MGLSLQPRVIKSTQADYQRFLMADNKVLRFECVFGHDHVSEMDQKRSFVVNYNLGDDTIMVYEPPIRNSGLEGGVFLARLRYKKYIPDQRLDGPPKLKNHGSARGRVGLLPRRAPGKGRLVQS